MELYLDWIRLYIKTYRYMFKEHKNFSDTKFNFENFTIYVYLNDSIIEFIEEILHKISSEKKS